MKKHLKYHLKFEESYNLIDLLYYISLYSWEELKLYNETSSATVGEVRITETLVSEIYYALCQPRVQLPIRLFHAKDEKTNGNDMEIIVPVGKNEYIVLPCQAKRLYVEKVKDNLKSKYAKISHILNKDKPNQQEQIVSLLNYAHEIGGFPLYMFYNYTKGSVKLNSKIPIEELYGCTLVNANLVYERFYKKETQTMTSFTFQEIHPPACPLVSLLDLNSNSQLKDFFGESKTQIPIRVYSSEELLNQPLWVEHCPPMSVDTDRRGQVIKLEALLGKPYFIEESRFNPKFRIMMLNKPEIFRNTKNIEL
jgi:hypothetical protein